MVGAEEKKSYADYCRQLRSVSDSLTELKEIAQRRNWSVTGSRRPSSPVIETKDEID